MGRLDLQAVDRLFGEQLDRWPQARDNYAALQGVSQKELTVNGFPVLLQFNPARIVSSGAKVDAKTIRERKCFLCASNRPPVQDSVSFEASSGHRYEVLLNPFPIFPRHLTIPDRDHTDQRIAGRIGDMLELADELPDFVIFYNGPRCGASAPDHMHFQAGNKGFLPLQERLADIPRREFFRTEGTRLSMLESFLNGCFVIESVSAEETVWYFEELYRHLPAGEEGSEPMMNLLCWKSGDRYCLLTLVRRRHRPACYFAEGEDNLLISPASVDLGGVFIAPLQKDFERITGADLAAVADEVCLDRIAQDELYRSLEADFRRFQPTVSVGIQFEPEIRAEFSGVYRFGEQEVTGLQSFVLEQDRIRWQGGLYGELLFVPSSPGLYFELKDVTIGINFHWERRENQRFGGALRIIVEGDRLTAVNLTGVEDYLLSVISSEMSATASKSLLKAHAVISRSWLLAQISKNRELVSREADYCSCLEDADSRIRWYDREDHTRFDVCADDHCQRYQGITRATSETVAEVIAETWGEILTYDGRICDARFSKCCGGISEEFENCWEEVRHPYLVKVEDSEAGYRRVESLGREAADRSLPDLTREEAAEQWILSEPDAFCHTSDRDILSQVLNDYDQETAHFYRWKQEYGQKELSALIRERSGIDFGDIVALEPVQRGPSGRLIRLRIVGTRRTMVIGKELEIRRTLSPSHLYSSAFVVRTEGTDSDTGLPARFVLYGAGWGHGVGLCQIGAAVMGARGYSYDRILAHYFVNASIECKY